MDHVNNSFTNERATPIIRFSLRKNNNSVARDIKSFFIIVLIYVRKREREREMPLF